MVITNETDLKTLLAVAKQTLSAVESGEIFLVRDLFRGFEWKRIDIGKRNKLGSIFLMYVEDEGKGYIKPLGKTSQNQQQYLKL